jgi:hypothetical protein
MNRIMDIMEEAVNTTLSETMTTDDHEQMLADAPDSSRHQPRPARPAPPHHVTSAAGRDWSKGLEAARLAYEKKPMVGFHSREDGSLMVVSRDGSVGLTRSRKSIRSGK